MSMWDVLVPKKVQEALAFNRWAYVGEHPIGKFRKPLDDIAKAMGRVQTGFNSALECAELHEQGGVLVARVKVEQSGHMTTATVSSPHVLSGTRKALLEAHLPAHEVRFEVGM